MIRAFHNSCRHRGSTLCRATKGSSPKIVCPYHQWTYELDGRLLWARDMDADFDPKQHGLNPVHCRDVHGLIYICLADDAPAFDAFVEEAARYLAPHDLANSKVAFETTIVEKGNWKLVWENNRECYHCAGNHPSLTRTFPEDPRLSGGVGGEGLSDVLDRHVARCELGRRALRLQDRPAGPLALRPHAAPRHRRELHHGRQGRGREAELDPALQGRRRPPASSTTRRPGTTSSPTTPILFRVTPISETESEVCTKWLVHKDAQEGVDYDLKRLTEVWVATNDEDRVVVENNQQGILSPGYRPGPYSSIQESGVIQFVDWYVDTLGRSFADRTLVAAE